MALTKKVELKLRQLFKEKAYHITNNKSIEEGLQNYFKYRNLICDEIYKNTLDLTEAKKVDWWHQFKLDEGDCISIMTDSIFKVIDTYDESKNNKFVTFFYTILNNTLKNHLKYLTTKRKTSFFNEASYKDAAEKEARKRGIKNKKTHERNIERLYTLSETLEQEDFDSLMNAKFYSEYMLNKLSGNERQVLEGILNGETHQEIAKRLKVTRPYISEIFKKIQQKFNYIKEELCQNEKLC